jgi:hypothetical protein
MSNPKPILTPELMTSLTHLKPAEAVNRQPGSKIETKAPMPKVKASTKPVRSTMGHSRSTNRGK